MPEVHSVNPRTGEATPTGIHPTAPEELDAVCRRAREAFEELSGRDRAWRADLLRALADGLEARRAEIVDTADGETGLGQARLGGELTRTCFQLRMFADVVLDGGFLEATIDHAGDTEMGPRPDLRRMLIPLGPVAVFGASNFPLAFSVPGGDTASALAAGCPVVVKAHESHPLTSALCGAALTEAATKAGAPAGTIAVVHGREAGVQLVQHPAITAVGFTGSRAGGTALQDLVNQRPDPIPFYGELAGINPLVVTAEAADERAEAIAEGLAASYQLGSGQFCTKPGLAFVPRTGAGERLVDAVADATRGTEGQLLLNEGIRDGYAAGARGIAAVPGVSALAAGENGNGSGFTGQAQVLAVEAAELDGRLTEECFGPLLVVVRDRDEYELISALSRLEPSLTATVHLGSEEAPRRSGLLGQLRRLSGRLVFDGYPTGVAVSWAQHHGGPWPSTTAIHTSVGATAIRRFLRPYTWQNAPQAVLPAELRDGEVDIPRRMDGALTPPRHG
jgi:NADP-dependent aldehyde dehydrogenase